MYAIINEESKVHDIYIFQFYLISKFMHLIHTKRIKVQLMKDTVTECVLMTLRFLADELVHEKEKYKYICDDLDLTFTELVG